ncbi:MAG: thymidylate synthase [Patescibacteria group bacterium]
MKPYSERTIDTQYRDLLTKILNEGTEVNPIHGIKSKMILGHQFRFDMKNGFPMITERDLSGKFIAGALGEHIAFLHGAHTHEELSKFGCPWWDRWVTPEKCAIFGLEAGDLGPGSYGAAWATFPTAEGEPFNQIKHLIKQIKDMPFLRTHLVTPWIPQYTLQHKELKRKVVVAPCHGWMHVLIFPETNEMSLHHFQRSGDIPVGVPFNMMQYAAFLMMLAQVTGYKPKEYVHTFSDAHMYENQYEKVKELLQREPRRFPTVTLDPNIKDIFDFRPEHFTVTDYEPHPKMLIPTPV